MLSGMMRYFNSLNYFSLGIKSLWATVIGLLKNWPVKIRPVILALLLYANEVWHHIFQILKNTTGH